MVFDWSSLYLPLVAVHVVLSVLLVLIIILQPGKGGDVGAAFGGGGGGGMFGPRGPTSILQTATTWVAIGFMVTSISLAMFSDRAVLTGGGGLDEELNRVQERKSAVDEAPPADDALPDLDLGDLMEGDAEPAAPADEAPAGAADEAPEAE